MENKIKDSKATAVTKKKGGDQRGAIMALKNMKMYEGELTKLDGQIIMLQQQKMTIASAVADHEVITALQTGNQQIKAINEGLDVGAIDEVMADLADAEEEKKQRDEIFENYAVEGNEELDEELERLIAEELAGEIMGTVVNSNPIAAPAQAAAPITDEAQLASLRTDMAELNAL